jgi:hypothetical protein
MLRIPHCLDNRLTEGGKVVSPMHRTRSTLLSRNVSILTLINVKRCQLATSLLSAVLIKMGVGSI